MNEKQPKQTVGTSDEETAKKKVEAFRGMVEAFVKEAEEKPDLQLLAILIDPDDDEAGFRIVHTRDIFTQGWMPLSAAAQCVIHTAMKTLDRYRHGKEMAKAAAEVEQMLASEEKARSSLQ